MGYLYDLRSKAIAHTVKKGETLTAIAAGYTDNEDVPDDLDWKELALYNWGTVDAAQVALALCERVGSSSPVDFTGDVKPDELLLDPAFGPSSPAPIWVPKVWKAKALDVNKKHTIEARLRTIAPAIGITKLDKWFIPGKETCDANYYALSGSTFAGKVRFEVYGSNYGKYKGLKDGFPDFEPLANVPVFSADVDGGTIRDWYGLSKCTEGALSSENHPLNVAFSPYTASLRYAREGAHAGARIDLDPFWVLFDGGDKPVADSCKISWKLEKADVTVGMLQIVGRDGKAVFAKGLNATDLTSGKYQWGG